MGKGWAVDVGGYSAGLWVPALAGLCGAAIALLTVAERGETVGRVEALARPALVAVE